MDTKLTLKLDKAVIERAKRYAEKRQISLSKMVEKYFNSLADEEKAEFSPLVRELLGIISLKSDMDLMEDYTDYLLEKYR